MKLAEYALAIGGIAELDGEQIVRRVRVLQRCVILLAGSQQRRRIPYGTAFRPQEDREAFGGAGGGNPMRSVPIDTPFIENPQKVEPVQRRVRVVEHSRGTVGFDETLVQAGHHAPLTRGRMAAAQDRAETREEIRACR